MNTPNINNSNAGDLVGRNRGIDSRSKADRLQSPEASGALSGSGDATDAQAVVTPVRDSFQTTQDRDFVRELAERVPDEAPVREEAVQRARDRVAEGYYNNREFLGTLASKLINTD